MPKHNKNYQFTQYKKNPDKGNQKHQSRISIQNINKTIKTTRRGAPSTKIGNVSSQHNYENHKENMKGLSRLPQSSSLSVASLSSSPSSSDNAVGSSPTSSCLDVGSGSFAFNTFQSPLTPFHIRLKNLSLIFSRFYILLCEILNSPCDLAKRVYAFPKMSSSAFYVLWSLK